MKSPSSRTRAIAAFAAAPVAVLVAGAMVWQGSQAAFTATTRNSGSAWSTGSVTLTDDDLGAAAFTVENIVPGQTGQKCIVVTSNSNVPGEVRAYTQNLISDRGLENRIFFDLEQGTGGSFNDCTGFTPGSSVNLGSVNLKQNFAKNRKTVVFNATMTASTETGAGVPRTVVTVVLGTAASGGSGVRTAGSAASMVWTPTAAVTSLTGTACSLAPLTEPGTLDRDF